MTHIYQPWKCLWLTLKFEACSVAEANMVPIHSVLRSHGAGSKQCGSLLQDRRPKGRNSDAAPKGFVQEVPQDYMGKLKLSLA